MILHAQRISRRSAAFRMILRVMVLLLMFAPLVDEASATGSRHGNAGNGRSSPVDGSSPDAFGYGDIRVKTKSGSGALLKGACYFAYNDQNQGFGCDHWDGATDGYTMLENLRIGSYTVYMSLAPEGYFFPPQRTGIRVTDGGETALLFTVNPGSSKVVVRSKTPEGTYILDACAQVLRNGTAITPVTCDWYDGTSDGKITISGLYVPPGQTQTWVVEQRVVPSGFVKAANKSISVTNGQSRNVTFTNSRVSLSPSCIYSASTLEAFGTISFTCKGFASYQNLTPSVDDVDSGFGYCDVQGRCSGSVYLPELTAGNHSLKIKSPSHAAGTKTIKVLPGVRVFPAEGKGGTAVFVSMAGFKAGEKITIRRQGSSTILAGPVTASSKGSATAALVVPDGAAATLTFYAAGDGGSVAKTTFSRTGPASITPTRTATPVPTATVTSTATPSQTATAQPTDTEVPTETATDVVLSTETSTAVPEPSQTPAESTATDVPSTETPTLEPATATPAT